MLRLTTYSIIVQHASNPNFVSPTDNLVTPVTQKLNAAKKKQFTKYVFGPDTLTFRLTLWIGWLSLYSFSLHKLHKTTIVGMSRLMEVSPLRPLNGKG